LSVGHDRVSGGGFWTRLNGDAQSETVTRTSGVVVGENVRLVKGALSGGRVVLNVEKRAVLDQTREVSALIDSRLEKVCTTFPANNEVTMVPVSCDVLAGTHWRRKLVELTGRVTSREDKLSVNASKGIGVPDGLEEERRKFDRKSFGAISSHDLVWESNVVAVVRRVEILSVPAAWKHELQAETIGTLRVQERLFREEVAVERSFRGGVVVETVETDGVLSQSRLGREVGTSPVGLWRIRNRVIGEVAKSFVSGDHLEAVREGSNVAGRVG